MKILIILGLLATLVYPKCYKTIESIRYKEQLVLNQNIMRVQCNVQTENISIEDKYAKYYLKKNEYITESKILKIKPKRIVFKVNDKIEFVTSGDLVEEREGYVKIKKPNQEIKKYRIK